MLKRYLLFLTSWQWNGIKMADLMIIIIILSSLMLTINKTSLAKQRTQYMEAVKIDLVVPNLDAQVASQIQVSDLITDQKGKACFEIIEKIERPAEHPVIDSEGQIIVAQHPKMVSLFLTLRSLEPIEFRHGIKYNWQVIKTGGSLIWETRFCRFVGLVRKIN
jgi:hypothetical protein